MAEILGIISLVGQILTAVDKVIAVFDRIQNAPRNIREFRNVMTRLSIDFAYLQSEAERDGSITISTDDRDEIHQILQKCKVFFDRYNTTLTSQGAFSDVRRAFWSVTNGLALDGHRDCIYRIYTNIITPVWLRLISTRQIGNGIYAPAAVPQIAGSSTNEIEPPPQEAPRPLARTDNTETPIPDERIHEIDENIRQYRTVLGVAVDDMLYHDAVTVDDESFKPIAATLHLDKALKHHRVLQLHELQITTHNKTMVLHFRSRDRSILIKHLVPLSSSIPFTTDTASLEVRFLNLDSASINSANPHSRLYSITVIDDRDGHYLYQTPQPPRYTFPTVKSRRKFQSFVRQDRKLKAEFETIDISAVSVTGRRQRLAVAQVVQLWVKTRQPHYGQQQQQPQAVVTMAFLATPVGGKEEHVEWFAEDFAPDPGVVVVGRGMRKRVSMGRGKGRVLVLRWLYGDRGEVEVTFGSEDDARSFKRLLDEYYPKKCEDDQARRRQEQQQEPPRLELSDLGMSALELSPSFIFGSDTNLSLDLS
ncbi:hypothetical protein B0T17DRAFT_648492 [Bombardia bombarda]|uniref:Uncharacterized protein n=1 Tax=Bombardia bombarda TaxID=252184 RepID=A0AA39TI87_9PEZI|nr:hypothetical protein B0T17DRAFT_648492 [Bombardia bombarda]